MEVCKLEKKSICLQLYLKPLNMEEHLSGRKYNKPILKNKINAQKCISLPFGNTHTVTFLSLQPDGIASLKSCAPKVPTTISSVSIFLFFSQKSIANGTVEDTRQTEEQKL